MSRVIEALPAGAFTLSGKNRGPAVPLGRNRYNKSQTIFMHESELRQAIQDMGWPQPEDHSEVQETLAKLAAELEQAQQDVAHLEEKAQTLERAVGFTSEPLERKIAELRDALEQSQADLEQAQKEAKPPAAPKAESKPKRRPRKAPKQPKKSGGK